MITRHLRESAIAAVIALACFMGCAHRIGGGQPGIWELRGAIVDASAGRLRVLHKTGQVVDLVIDDRTVILHDERPQGHDALRRGRRVRIEVEILTGGGDRARTVRVYGGSDRRQ